MNLVEALGAARGMLHGNPYRHKADAAYLNAIAQVFMRYPKDIALACADPSSGVATESEYMPTTAAVTAWCEKKMAPIYQAQERYQRAEAQLKARDEYNAPKSPALIAKMKAWTDRTDPIAITLSKNAAKEEEERKRNGLEMMERANRAVFIKECERDGIDPAGGVSPALKKILGDWNVSDGNAEAGSVEFD